MKGTFADAEGVHPFHESLADGGVDPWEGKPVIRPIKPRHAPESTVFEVAPVRRRAPEERLAEVTQRIYDEALKSYRVFGRVVFPASVLADIQHEFWVAGEPITLEQIERLAEDEIRPLCERYAAQKLAQVHRAGQANEGYAFGVGGN